jgi:hypothetical protein
MVYGISGGRGHGGEIECAAQGLRLRTSMAESGGTSMMGLAPVDEDGNGYGFPVQGRGKYNERTTHQGRALQP